LPWLAELEVERANSIWRANPDAAFRRLDRADDLNPLSPRASLTAGTIALRVDRPAVARREFREAMAREPRNSYAPLELGAIAAAEGDRREALRLVRRAAALSPRDAAVRLAERRLRRGRSLDPVWLNRRILERVRGRGNRTE
jgi:Flp pilus assembly protein TadD